MTVWSARAVAFPGLSLLATVCVAGCGTGSGDGHQVTRDDAAVAPPALEGTGGGGNFFPSVVKGRPADAGVPGSGTNNDAGAPSRTEPPSKDGGPPEPDAAPPAPTCIPEGG